MVIVLLSPTLQTRDMDKLSTAHLGITQMGIIRGYERSVQTVRDLCFCFVVTISKTSLFVFSLLGRLPAELQTWSWSGTQRSVKRQHSSNAILKRPFHNDCD